jgi:hypothetical protein
MDTYSGSIYNDLSPQIKADVDGVVNERVQAINARRLADVGLPWPRIFAVGEEKSLRGGLKQRTNFF